MCAHPTAPEASTAGHLPHPSACSVSALPGLFILARKADLIPSPCIDNNFLSFFFLVFSCCLGQLTNVSYYSPSLFTYLNNIT